MEIIKSPEYNWHLQKGCKVVWYDGHKKGRGVVVQVNYKGYNESEHSFSVKDDGTGDVNIFRSKNLRWIKKEREI